MRFINENVDSKRYVFFSIMIFAIRALRTAMFEIVSMLYISTFYFSNVFEKIIENQLAIEIFVVISQRDFVESI